MSAALELDGSLDQRDEIAAVVVEQYRAYQKIRDDYNLATNALRDAMLASGKRSMTMDGYSLKIEKQSVFWCVAHQRPPVYCKYLHDDANPVAVVAVALDPQLVVRKAEAE